MDVADALGSIVDPRACWFCGGPEIAARSGMGDEMEQDEVRTKVSGYMEDHGLKPGDLARRLHPHMTGEDVTRYLNGEEIADEDRRKMKVSSIMAMFVYGLEPDECE